MPVTISPNVDTRSLLHAWVEGRIRFVDADELKRLIRETLDATEPQPVDAVLGGAATKDEQFMAEGGIVTEPMVAYYGLKSGHIHFKDPLRLETLESNDSHWHSVNLGMKTLPQDAETTEDGFAYADDEAAITLITALRTARRIIELAEASDGDMDLLRTLTHFIGTCASIAANDNLHHKVERRRLENLPATDKPRVSFGSLRH